MAARTTLNAKNLEALGAPRLAELLIEITTGNAAAKRHLRLELAGAASPREAAREIRKRLTTLARARSFVDWWKQKELVEDLDGQRRAIAEKVAPEDPAEALDLAWRFMDLAPSVFERTDDSNGEISPVFHRACADLAAIAARAAPDPESLADRVFAAIQDNGYGQYDGLIEALAPSLGPRGIARLKAQVVALSGQPVPRPPDGKRQRIGWSSHGGDIYADEIAERARQGAVRFALATIADLESDVDAFIALHDAKARTSPMIAAEIALRLLAAGRAGEALAALDAAHSEQTWIIGEWEAARLEALESLGRGEEAQAFRWSLFETRLSAEHLRAHLRRLPDFEDIEAEERALAHAAAHPDFHAALRFLVHWPALDRAAVMVLARAPEMDGNRYETLSPAAEMLADRHPLAATLLLREMIDFTLTSARSTRYRHAARHLAECARLAPAVPDLGASEPHDAYVARLRAGHGRKDAFWTQIP